MLKSKYTYKDFIEVYLNFLSAENNTQKKEYYLLVYESLSKYFDVILDSNFYNKNEGDYEVYDDYESLRVLDELMIEYVSLKDTLHNYPINIIGFLAELNSKFNPSYREDTKKRKKLLFEMIYFLFSKHYGSSKKIITHEQLKNISFDLGMFEKEMTKILDNIYKSREQKNMENWSLIYYKEDLLDLGYSCLLPSQIEEKITIGNYQIKGVSFSGLGYSLKPL